MKVAFVLAAVLAVTLATEDACFDSVSANCQAGSSKITDKWSDHCSANYGALNNLEPDISRYANRLIERSFNFMILGIQYGDYLKNRPGFRKLFNGLSDELWEDGIETIKYLTSRGGEMNFLARDAPPPCPANCLDLNEMHALGKALDIQKELAKKAFQIHHHASKEHKDHHDPEIAHHFEEKFMGKQRKSIRTLAGYASDLGRMLEEDVNKTDPPSLALHLFDRYLEK